MRRLKCSFVVAVERVFRVQLRLNTATTRSSAWGSTQRIFHIRGTCTHLRASASTANTRLGTWSRRTAAFVFQHKCVQVDAAASCRLCLRVTPARVHSNPWAQEEEEEPEVSMRPSSPDVPPLVRAPNAQLQGLAATQTALQSIASAGLGAFFSVELARGQAPFRSCVKKTSRCTYWWNQ